VIIASLPTAVLCGRGSDRRLAGTQRATPGSALMLLYDSSVSGNCYKVRLVFAQLGLEYES
jgi:hypothetical protein